MPDNFQFGNEHHFYFAHNAGVPWSLNTRPTDTTPDRHFNDPAGTGSGGWAEYLNIRDVSESANNNKVDITTREEARQGLSSNVIATVEGSMTLEIRYKPNLTDGTVQDLIFAALLRASRFKTEIAAVDLDRAIDIEGAQGQVGNWVVAMTRTKPVAGLVVANVTLDLSSYGDWIIAQDTSGTNFAVLS